MIDTGRKDWRVFTVEQDALRYGDVESWGVVRTLWNEDGPQESQTVLRVTDEETAQREAQAMQRSYDRLRAIMAGRQQ